MQHTCRNCGEEFATIAETIDHPCTRGLGEPCLAYTPPQPTWRPARSLSNGDPVRNSGPRTCYRCGQRVATGEGQVEISSEREYRTAHLSCPVVVVTPPQTDHRPNRYAGSCDRCGNWVPENAGQLVGSSASGFHVRHLDGQCPSATVRTSAPVTGNDVAEAIARLSDGEIHNLGTVEAPIYYRTRRPRIRSAMVADRLYRRGDSVRWVYSGRAPLPQMTTETRISWEQARDFGLLSNHCIRCARQLTDVRSVAQGYGPICAHRMGWPVLTVEQSNAELARRDAAELARLEDAQRVTR